MRTWVVALAAGVLAALLVSGLPASAADQQVAAQTPADTWSPNDVAISQGESVTWSNPSSGLHNVCVAKPGLEPSSGCGEFRNGDGATDWSSYTNAHTFTTPGTYKFMCQVHGSTMAGTVTVQASGTGTTNTETITETTTTPTQTSTQAMPAPDTTAPAFAGKLGRKSSRKSLILKLGSSEAASLEATVFRRAPGTRPFRRVGATSVDVKVGRNTVTLPRRAAGRVRSGAYRVKLFLADAAGNRSRTRILSFKIA